MRGILNLSMPIQMIQDLKAEAKAEGFATLSEYIRHIIREWKKMRYANEMQNRLEDMKNGKGIAAKSARELMG